MIDRITSLLEQVSSERLERDLRYLAADPLPRRTVNYRRPGVGVSTLEEADAYLEAELAAAGYRVDRESVTIQAFRFAPEKPYPHRFEFPEPDDPKYEAVNLYAEKRGEEKPDRILLLLAHKDSQSWIDSPGANDNATGTVSILEIARVLAAGSLRATVRFLFCNEEHVPWTSVTAAERAKARGDDLYAIINQDASAGVSPEDHSAGRKTLVSVWTEPAGEVIARMMTEMNREYELGLESRTERRESPGDDDGSFIKAGYPSAIVNIGSWPYTEPNYHRRSDTPETVDIGHLHRVTQATLAAVLTLDRQQ